MNRPAWRAAIRKGTKHFERSRLQSLDDKRSARKNRVPNPSTAAPYQLCGKICASTFGLQAHMRKHQHWRVIFEIEGLLLLDMPPLYQWYDTMLTMIRLRISATLSYSNCNKGVSVGNSLWPKQKSAKNTPQAHTMELLLHTILQYKLHTFYDLYMTNSLGRHD